MSLGNREDEAGDEAEPEELPDIGPFNNLRCTGLRFPRDKCVLLSQYGKTLFYCIINVYLFSFAYQQMTSGTRIAWSDAFMKINFVPVCSRITRERRSYEKDIYAIDLNFGADVPSTCQCGGIKRQNDFGLDNIQGMG